MGFQGDGHKNGVLVNLPAKGREPTEITLLLQIIAQTSLGGASSFRSKPTSIGRVREIAAKAD